jgi:hypothetical protein
MILSHRGWKIWPFGPSRSWLLTLFILAELGVNAPRMPARAAVFTRVSGSVGTFQDPSKWTANSGFPTAADDVVFPSSSGFPSSSTKVNFTANQASRNLSSSSSAFGNSVVLDLNGFNYSVNGMTLGGGQLGGSFSVFNGSITVGSGTGTISNSRIFRGNGVISAGDFDNRTFGSIQAASSTTTGLVPSTLVLNNAELNLWGSSTIKFDITNASGIAGVGWGLITAKSVDFSNAGPTSTFGLVRLNVFIDRLSGFDPFQNYEWGFLRVDNATSGFTGGLVDQSFIVNVSSPLSNVDPTRFSVRQSSNSAVLQYAAIPEGASVLLVGMAIGMVGMGATVRGQLVGSRPQPVGINE